jgi:PAS domain S-box-containing protein
MKFQRENNQFITAVSLFSIFIAAAVIAGWELDIPVLETVLSDLISMKFNTALGFIFISAALLVTQLPVKKYNTAVFLILSSLTFLIGSVTLFEYLFQYNAGIDQLFAKDHVSKANRYPFPGRMAVNTALCFVFLGVSFFSFKIKNGFVKILGQYLLHSVTFISSVSVIGYLYGLSLFYSLSSISSMALNTAVLFFSVSVTASLLQPSIGITGLFTGKLVGNKMARRLIALIALMLTIFGILRVQTQRIGLFNFQIAISLAALCFLLAGLAILWHTAIWLNRVDLKRYEAEEQVKVINESLEQRVEERSAELKAALEKFRENEARFRIAFEHSAIGMAFVSPGLQWLKVNKQLCDLFGYSEEEMLGINIMDVTHPDDKGISATIVEDSLAGGREIYRVEKRYLTKSNAIIWVLVNFSLVKESDGLPGYFVSQYVDITARKEAEIAQKTIIENEERLRTLFDNVDGATCLADTNFRLIAFNREYERIYKILAGEPPNVGDEAYGFLPAEEKERRYNILNHVLLGNKATVEAEYDREGQHFYFRTSFNPVIVDGKVTAISSYSMDLTSWKEAENKVRKADARFRAIVESVFVGIKLTDANWNILYRSPSMQAITGWTDDEMKSSYLQFTHPEDVGIVEGGYTEASATPGKFVNITYRCLHRNGNYIWVEALLCNKLADPDLQANIMVIREITERKTIEDQLKKSEEKYRSLIEHASDAIYLLDFDGRIIEVNESMCSMTGYTRNELLKLNISELIDPEELKLAPVDLTFPGNGEPVIRERRFLHGNGAIFEVEVNAKTFDDNKKLVIARNITGRKKMEAELRKAELTFRTLAEKSMVGVYIYQNERLVFANKRFAEIFGYELYELVNTEKGIIEILYAQEERQRIKSYVDSRITGEIEAMSYEVTGTKKDGTFNRIESYGSKVMLDGVPTIIGTIIDITERAKAAEVLKRSEANLKIIMETTETAYVLMDRKLNVMEYNQMAVNFSNLQFHHFPAEGELLSQFIPKKLHSQFIKNAGKVLEGNSINYEVNLAQPNGDINWYYVSLHPITKDKNEILGLMLSITDITDRKNIEENLRTTYLQVQDHINRIKVMAWKQSHLIRAPLANLKGLADILGTNPSDFEVIRYIKTELDKLDNIIIEMAEEAADN